MFAVRAAEELALFLGDLLHHERMVALGALFLDRLVPTGKVAFGVLGTTVEQFLAASTFLDNLAVAAGLRAVDTQRDRLGALTIGVSGASQKTSEAPDFHHHR